MNAISQVSGTAVPIIGDDIDTDRIVPARFLKEVTFENMGNYLFIDARQNDDGSPNDHTLNNPAYKNASIMVVGRNFGCGSSREHAPQAIKRAGFNAIIGESFSEIFSGNCLSLGVPTVIMGRDQIEMLQALINAEPHTRITIDIEAKEVRIGENENTVEETKTTNQVNEDTFDETKTDSQEALEMDSGKAFEEKVPEFTQVNQDTFDETKRSMKSFQVLPILIKAETRSAFLSGNWNAKSVLKSNMAKIQTTAESLPYISGY